MTPMTELRVDKIAMSTRVALPIFMGCRMSELRRHLPPSPPPSQERTAQVRKNLFGPIDHDENTKFVQDELKKISQADCKRWNFDFQSEKPHEGRYDWEAVEDGVPQAYDLPCLTSKPPTSANAPLPAPKPTHKSAAAMQQKPSTSAKTTLVFATTTTTTTTPITIPLTTSNTTPVTTPTTSQAATSATPPLLDEARKDSARKDDKIKTEIPPARITRKSSQTQVTDFLKIRKSKRPAPKAEEEPPPTLVKRPRTTS